MVMSMIPSHKLMENQRGVLIHLQFRIWHMNNIKSNAIKIICNTNLISSN